MQRATEKVDMAAGPQTAGTPFAQNLAFVAAAGVVALAVYPVHTLMCASDQRLQLLLAAEASLSLWLAATLHAVLGFLVIILLCLWVSIQPHVLDNMRLALPATGSDALVGAAMLRVISAAR